MVPPSLPDIDKPVVLDSFRSEAEASIVVSTLGEIGIEGQILDDQKGRFEGTGQIHVLVCESELGMAREALNQVRAMSAEIDWSKVDVGQTSDHTTPDGNRHIQLVLAAALVLVLVFLVVQR